MARGYFLRWCIWYPKSSQLNVWLLIPDTPSFFSFVYFLCLWFSCSNDESDDAYDPLFCFGIDVYLVSMLA